MDLEQITLSDLKSVLSYCPESGEFTWIETTCKRLRPGDRAGGSVRDGYRRIEVFGRRYKEHRLAWFYMTGNWAPVIDHVNGVRSDNRWCNLRAADVTKNNHNVAITVRSKTGVKGLHWHVAYKCWQGHIRVDGRKISKHFHPSTHGGVEAAKAAAIQWVQKTRTELHGEFANHG